MLAVSEPERDGGEGRVRRRAGEVWEVDLDGDIVVTPSFQREAQLLPGRIFEGAVVVCEPEPLALRANDDGVP